MRVLRELTEAIFLAIIIFIFVQFAIQNYKVEGVSMNPTLEENQMLIANKLVYLKIDWERVSKLFPFIKTKHTNPSYIFNKPKRGDIIIFQWSINRDKNLVKRIIGLPGDTLEIRRNKVYLNGVEFKEMYLFEPEVLLQPMEKLIIPSGHYFVLGDNRRQSNDSRHWGVVHEADIIGRIWFIYWPFESFSSSFKY